VRELTAAPPDPDDWYAILLWLDGRKCLLLTHAGFVEADDQRTGVVDAAGCREEMRPRRRRGRCGPEREGRTRKHGHR